MFFPGAVDTVCQSQTQMVDAWCCVCIWHKHYQYTQTNHFLLYCEALNKLQPKGVNGTCEALFKVLLKMA